MSKILLVEDNAAFAGVIVGWLESQNFVVDVAVSGEDALQLLANFSYDLLILDWELPGMPGISVCERFRKNGGTTPILFLTARTDYPSRVTGLDTGADDYLVKPFEFSELGARIRALLRRPAGLVPNVLTVPGLLLETESRTAVVANTRIPLSQRESALLEYLLRHPNRSFSSKDLLDAVWPLESAYSEDTVRSCIRALRKKITVDGCKCVIKTSNWSGYMVESPLDHGKSTRPSA
jgi:DNA-binding response OmpR family regulator